MSWPSDIKRLEVDVYCFLVAGRTGSTALPHSDQAHLFQTFDQQSDVFKFLPVYHGIGASAFVSVIPRRNVNSA